MITLALHVDYIKVRPVEKAIESAEQLTEDMKEIHIKEALVPFVSVEEGDSEQVVNAMANLIEEHAHKVNTQNILVYPYVHLTDKPATPSVALELTKSLQSALQLKGFAVGRAPFGWYKSFELKVKGHPLSELSKRIGEKDVKEGGELVSQSLVQESQTKSQFFIMTPDGMLTPVEKFDFSKHRNLQVFANYEIKKSRVYERDPEHIILMKEHELVQPEPGSDVGNLRWLPKGRLMKKLLERHVTNTCINEGAVEVETPLMYDFQHPALEKYLNRFPSRQYVVTSDKKKFFLRFAACFGQFLIASSSTFSYKSLPLRIFELTRYSFRREQSGEVAGLRRLRAFTMPDMHTLTADLEQAKKDFFKQMEISQKMMSDIECDYEVAFRILSEWYEQNKEWYAQIAKKIGKPMLVEMFDRRYAYFITKFEFNVVDSLDKCTALSTVQIDVENAERFDISYVAQDGTRKRPYILHASVSGAVERQVYAILEKQGMIRSQGGIPKYPLWLAPTQVRIIPVSEDQLDYARAIMHKMKGKVRVDLDDRNESLGKRIREAEKEWVPYIVVVGKEEAAKGTVTVRKRGDKGQYTVNSDEVVTEITEKTAGYPFEELSLPRELSKRFAFI
ncbi:MAG: threonine--tRNA ligase [Candidatus Micrarchaeia archaeon]